MTDTLPSSSRRRGREVALQVLYALDVSSKRMDFVSADTSTSPMEACGALDVQTAFDAVEENFEMPEAAREFAHRLVTEVRGQLSALDAPISEHSANWRLERMAIVDRNILRLGAYELMQTDTPLPVVVNEAVDLARRFGSDPSPAFVNGILDALAMDVREPRP